MTTLEKRTEAAKALGLTRNGGQAQSLNGRTEQLYCPQHGNVKAVWGHCIECVDAGYRDWDGTKAAKTLIPDWVGLETDGRQVIVTRVHDALEAVQTISRYKHSNVDSLILIVWDRLITALDHGKIGPSWTLPESEEAADADAADEVECVRCCQPFKPVWGDERVCEECWRIENGPRRSPAGPLFTKGGSQ